MGEARYDARWVAVFAVGGGSINAFEEERGGIESRRSLLSDVCFIS